MAVITGKPIPPHVNTSNIETANYVVDPGLGLFFASPTLSGVWTLPSLENIIPGSILQINNTGTASITLVASGTDTISGSPTINSGHTAVINTDGGTAWRVSYTVPAVTSPIPPSSSVLTFQISSQQIVVGTTAQQVVGYFPWLQSVYSTVASASVILYSSVPGFAYTFKVLNGVTVLGTVTIASNGATLLTLASLPTSDATLTFVVNKTNPDPVNASIFGISLLMA